MKRPSLMILCLIAMVLPFLVRAENALCRPRYTEFRCTLPLSGRDGITRGIEFSQPCALVGAPGVSGGKYLEYIPFGAGRIVPIPQRLESNSKEASFCFIFCQLI